MGDEHRFEDMEKAIKLERDICRTAASFYEQAALDVCDIHEFSDRYLDSTFCTKSMQTRYSPLQREDAITCLEHLYPKIGGPETMRYGKEGMIFDPDAAWWFGYTYQQLYQKTRTRPRPNLFARGWIRAPNPAFEHPSTFCHVLDIEVAAT